MKTERILVLSALAIAIAACSSSGSSSPSTSAAPASGGQSGAAAGAAQGGGGTAGDTVIGTEILVNVMNNRIPPHAITVWVVGPSVGRLLLGNVGMNETKAFTFRAGNLNGDYKLIAQSQGGGPELPSQRFNLAPTLRFVQWSLDVNSIVQYQTPE